MSRGGVPERSNGAVLKTAGPSRASWVRIPPPPHDPKFEPASLPLGYVSDLYALLRAIDETMPKDATLYVEGSSIARAVREFLGARPAASDRELERGTRFPVPKTFHMPLEGGNLAGLRALAELHAEPEICDHLAVYRDDELLLMAHDAGFGDVEVASSLPEDAVRRFRLTLTGA